MINVIILDWVRDSIDILFADEEYLQNIYNGDVERYLVEELHYDPEQIEFMTGFKSINFCNADSCKKS